MLGVDSNTAYEFFALAFYGLLSRRPVVDDSVHGLLVLSQYFVALDLAGILVEGQRWPRFLVVRVVVRRLVIIH